MTQIEELLNLIGSTNIKSASLPQICAVTAQAVARQLERRYARRKCLLSEQAMSALAEDLSLQLARVTKPSFAFNARIMRLANRPFARCHLSDLSADNRQKKGKVAVATMRQLFYSFPALPALWISLICDWRLGVIRFMRRLRKDRRTLELRFFKGTRSGCLIGLRVGLSDPHRGGGTVMELQFKAGRVIYKPRSGVGEREWNRALRWVDRVGFRPRLRPLRVVSRRNYCWMELAVPACCADQQAARRFYQRVGAMIYLAHIFRAVDCHRENLIAAGEHPILIDAESLLHPADPDEPLETATCLDRTGFVPTRRGLPGWRYPSSPLCGHAGAHNPTVKGRSCEPFRYRSDVLKGLLRTQRLIGVSTEHRRAFARRLARLEKLRWRWIVRPTQEYLRLRDISIQPGALISIRKRQNVIRKLCISTRLHLPDIVTRAEAAAIERFDVPYFTRRMTSPAKIVVLPFPPKLLDDDIARFRTVGGPSASPPHVGVNSDLRCPTR